MVADIASVDRHQQATLCAARIDRCYRARMISWAQTIVGEQSLAEDVCQEVLASIVRRPTAEPKDLEAWLWRCTINTSINLVRSESRRRRREQHVCGQIHNADPADRANASSLDDEAGHLLQLVCELAETDRNMVYAHVVDGLTFAAIGRQHGISRNAVKKRVDRSLSRLRQKLISRGLPYSMACLTMLFGAARQMSDAGLLPMVTRTLGRTASITLWSQLTSWPGLLAGTGLLIAGLFAFSHLAGNPKTMEADPSASPPGGLEQHEAHISILPGPRSLNYLINDNGRLFRMDSGHRTRGRPPALFSLTDADRWTPVHPQALASYSLVKIHALNQYDDCVGLGVTSTPHAISVPLIIADGHAIDLACGSGLASDINAHRQVVGHINKPDGQHGFRYDIQAMQLQLLPKPQGYTFFKAVAINSHGDIAGTAGRSVQGVRQTRAFVLSHHGVFTDLGEAARTATGILDDGTVIGMSAIQVTYIRDPQGQIRLFPRMALLASSRANLIVGNCRTQGPVLLAEHGSRTMKLPLGAYAHQSVVVNDLGDDGSVILLARGVDGASPQVLHLRLPPEFWQPRAEVGKP